ncbi:hypothetical protein [Nitrobacter winogradskyi]|uniref:Uncharacterized protein n=2 Tax=Nitrobacter winogradskyi TaxID=913 RepID=A0ACC6AEZ4_NITWI|nr:hypothetical protein [Nitrobacter winogradskyi]MCP1998259.1 hypothetical protein [Nitrobacter winogradskyi]GEC15154.1 hypothetical protein NWI01_10460 [Nitrobacter winogradskyi]
MALSANGARGEVPLRVGSVDLVIAAEIGRLAAVSTALDCKSFGDLYQRLLGVEVAATIAGVQHLAVKGDGARAAAELTLPDFPACAKAFAAALSHHLKDSEGKAKAGDEGAPATTTTSPSRSATG